MKKCVSWQRTHIYKHTHTHIHTYIHTYIYIYIYIHTHNSCGEVRELGARTVELFRKHQMHNNAPHNVFRVEGRIFAAEVMHLCVWVSFKGVCVLIFVHLCVCECFMPVWFFFFCVFLFLCACSCICISCRLCLCVPFFVYVCSCFVCMFDSFMPTEWPLLRQ